MEGGGQLRVRFLRPLQQLQTPRGCASVRVSYLDQSKVAVQFTVRFFLGITLLPSEQMDIIWWGVLGLKKWTCNPLAFLSDEKSGLGCKLIGGGAHNEYHQVFPES